MTEASLENSVEQSNISRIFVNWKRKKVMGVIFIYVDLQLADIGDPHADWNVCFPVTPGFHNIGIKFGKQISIPVQVTKDSDQTIDVGYSRMSGKPSMQILPTPLNKGVENQSLFKRNKILCQAMMQRGRIYKVQQKKFGEEMTATYSPMANNVGLSVAFLLLGAILPGLLLYMLLRKLTSKNIHFTIDENMNCFSAVVSGSGKQKGQLIPAPAYSTPGATIGPGVTSDSPFQGGVIGGASGKSKVAAGILGIFFGGFGIHNFYLGYTKKAVAQIAVTFFTMGLGAVWGFVEGILILTGSINEDAQGLPLK